MEPTCAPVGCAQDCPGYPECPYAEMSVSQQQAAYDTYFCDTWDYSTYH